MTGAAFNTSERNRSNKASASFPEMMEPLNHRTIKILFLPGLGIYGFFFFFFLFNSSLGTTKIRRFALENTYKHL